MSVETLDLVIIGGGPAGMAAALEARRAGVSVTLLEERPTLGGQIYRPLPGAYAVRDERRACSEHRKGSRMIGSVAESGVDVRTGVVVWGIWDRRIAYVGDESESGLIEARCIVLATGARDRPVAFPGWTLPGVLTAGAAKSFVAKQLVLPGERILMAGSGALALAFSAQLLDFGADIVEVHEAAGPPRPGPLLRLVASADPTILVEAARYRARLLRRRIPLHYRSIIVRAEGEGEVQAAVVAAVDPDWRVIPGTERSIPVDTVLLGYGLETSTELSRLCGADHHYDEALGGWVPVRDGWMRTTAPGVLAVGDGSGVMGSVNAELEGQLAGIAATMDLGRLSTSDADERARPVRRRIGRVQRFQAALRDLYPIGPGIHELATDDTVVCRCEEVTHATLTTAIEEGAEEPGIVRARTRIGMGRCQGRNCANHVAAAIARHDGHSIDQVGPLSVRPPVKPVPLAAIAAERPQHHGDVDLDD